MMRKLALKDEILLKVDKPACYIGGEVNAVMKDPKEVELSLIHISKRTMVINGLAEALLTTPEWLTGLSDDKRCV